MPGRALGQVVGDGAERLDRPCGRVVGGGAAQLGRPLVGGGGERGEVVVPLRVVGARDPLGVGGAGGVEAAGAAVGDARVEHVGEVLRSGQRAVADGVGEGLAGVVAGQLGPAQDAGEGGGAVLGGDPGALLGGERARGGELVEPDRGAFGRGELGGVGEQLGRGAHAAGLLRGLGRDRQRGPRGDRVVGVEQAGEHRDGVAVQLVPLGALGGVVDLGDGGDVRGVGVAAAGERDVERGERRPRGDHRVGGVDGLALRGVHGGGVGQGEVLGDVGGGQHHPLPQSRAVGAGGEQGGDVEAAVVADAGDLVGLAVDRAAAVALLAGEVPAVEPGLDEVADPGDVALGGEGHPVLGDPAEADEFGAQLRGQSGGLLVGVDSGMSPSAGSDRPPDGAGRGGRSTQLVVDEFRPSVEEHPGLGRGLVRAPVRLNCARGRSTSISASRRGGAAPLAGSTGGRPWSGPSRRIRERDNRSSASIAHATCCSR